MDEYIKRKEALALVRPDAPEDEKTAVTIATAKKLVRSILHRTPSADVAPVVHGTWELRHGSWYCSNCGRGYKIKFGVAPACKHNYCPNCGARMDGDDDAKAD